MELYGWKQGLYDCTQYAQRVWISSSRSLEGLHKYSFFWVYVVVNIFGRINNSSNLVRNVLAEFKVLRSHTMRHSFRSPSFKLRNPFTGAVKEISGTTGAGSFTLSPTIRGASYVGFGTWDSDFVSSNAICKKICNIWSGHSGTWHTPYRSQNVSLCPQAMLH